MTTLLIGISVGLGALVVLLLALLVVRWRSDTSTDERVAEGVASLNTRMDELGRELAGAPGRAARALDHDVLHLSRARTRRESRRGRHPCRPRRPASRRQLDTRLPHGLHAQEGPRILRRGRTRARDAFPPRRPRDRKCAPFSRGAPTRRPRRADRPPQPALLPRDAVARVRPRAPLREQAVPDRGRPG